MQPFARFRTWLAALIVATPALAGYINFEVSHVHPIALTPTGSRLLVLNTPDARLEVFSVAPDGALTLESSVPVGLEPVSVVARGDVEQAWVVNQLSDSVSVVDLAAARVVRTLHTGDEPTDVAFAGGKAFVSVAGEDAIEVFDLASLDLAPSRVTVFGRKPRALAVSKDGTKVYAVVLHSGNRTTVVNAGVIRSNSANLDPSRLAALGLHDLACDGSPPAYPPLPDGIARSPTLPVPPGGTPPVGLIVRWNDSTSRWEDEAGQDWTHCLPFRMPDHDLFVIDATSLAPTEVDHLGTTLFDVAVNPADGRIWVPNTEARNFVRFEHPLGVQGHVVDDRISVVDPGSGYAVQVLDLNTHIDRGSDPATNRAEREASVSQPGMMVWDAAGETAWLTALGSRRVFRVDGTCSSGDCIFGPQRSAPVAVEVGEGPSGVALHGSGRLFVLDRFSNSIAVVDTVALIKLEEITLHDPSPAQVKQGRRFLYDAIDGSGHGDSACSSCHVSGDRDDLAWDLGNPEGELAPYTNAMDNVRFIVPQGSQPVECDPALCASQSGFDPQKGPMATQTLRGMLEPLHWRGDRSTMNNFNQAFPALMGTADIGPINGEAAGLSAEDMESFRQFTLGIRFPPNPHRTVNDGLPDSDVLVRGSVVPGNPSTGETIFNTFPTDAGQPCRACHAHPFGAAGGSLGGVTPAEPTSSATAALFNGLADQSPHSDLKVAHLRNMYEKMGPRFGGPPGPLPESVSGIGFTHDGSIPDLATFFSFSVFNLTPDQVADVAAFSLHFPTGTRPAVGQNLTVPAGTPPTGTAADESLLATLIGLGDLVSPARHCELVITTTHAGRERGFHLAGGVWVTDVAGESPLSLLELRQEATGPVTVLCAPIGSGQRLGGDRDEDAALDGDDCAKADPGAWSLPGPTTVVTVDKQPATHIAWTELASTSGPAVRYDVLGGSLGALHASGIELGTACVAGGLVEPDFDDPRPDPPAAEGWYYVVRGTDACGTGPAGSGRESLDARVCAGP